MSIPLETLGATSEPTSNRATAPARVRPDRPAPPGDDGGVSGIAPADRVSVSDEARARDAAPATRDARDSDTAAAPESAAPEAKPRDPGERARPKEGDGKLTPEQQEMIVRLRQRDAEVRAHEAAHQAVAGALGGGASFTYQLGPDGRQYAVGGEVPIEIGGGKTPQEMLSRARQVRAAALAPAKPSSQDLKVAASAAALETKVLADLRQQQVDKAAPKEKSKEAERQDPQVKEPGAPKPPPKSPEPGDAPPAADGPGSPPSADAPRPPPPSGEPEASEDKQPRLPPEGAAPPPRDAAPPPPRDAAPPPPQGAMSPQTEAPPADPPRATEPGLDAVSPAEGPSTTVIDDSSGASSGAQASSAANAVTNGWSSAAKAFDALVSANATESLHSSGNCAHCSPHLVLARA